MEIRHLKIADLIEAPWNANRCGPEILKKIENSVKRFGIVENEIVRPMEGKKGKWEVISGNHRLRIYRKLKFKEAPCVVVDLNDSEAKILSEVINNTRGEDDPQAKMQIINDLLSHGYDAGQLAELLKESQAEIERLFNQGSIDDLGIEKEQSDEEKPAPLTLYFFYDQHQLFMRAIEATGEEELERAALKLAKDYLDGINNSEK